MSKKYPIFKLWGAYAGAFIYSILIPGILVKTQIQAGIIAKILYFPLLLVFKIVPCDDWGCLGIFFIMFIILAPVIGFFAGYWIHRFFKK